MLFVGEGIGIESSKLQVFSDLLRFTAGEQVRSEWKGGKGEGEIFDDVNAIESLLQFTAFMLKMSVDEIDQLFPITLQNYKSYRLSIINY